MMLQELERHRVKQWLQHQKDIQAISCIIFLALSAAIKGKPHVFELVGFYYYF